jgi:ParB family transcriptional regulator, chromosome partitioning protein
MARRRLSPPAGDLLEADRSVPHAEPAGPPIARVAADAAATSAFEEMAETLRAAREGGRMVLDLPLDAVAPDHLARDRIPVDDQEMTALKASIRTHGQRAPIEVVALGREGAGALPYGLVSGWRRLAALRALHAETGEACFATVRALLTRPESAAAAYVAMVEENELRVGLSQYERARVAARAAARGVFPSEAAAVDALFAGASKAKLSRIRSFLALYHALDASLRFPQAIPERLGLALVERVREGRGASIVEALSAAAPVTPEAELALLTRLAAAPRPARTPQAPPEEILPGIGIETHRRGTVLTLILKGRGVTPELEARIRAALARLG